MNPSGLESAFAVLDRRLDAAASTPIAVAFSGGGDSLALLLCAAGWAARSRRPVLALTFDHRLHPDSAAWTRTAGTTARRLGADWRALAWGGLKPASGLPAAARGARHAALAEAAREAGARVLLIGHTADDVAESELIRKETATHGRLFEWSPSPAWPQGRGVFLLRPLLGLRRSALRAVLLREELEWLEDPANKDLRFARSRARARLSTGVSLTSEPLGADSPFFGTGMFEQWGDVANSERLGALDVEVRRLLGVDRPAELLARMLVCASGGSRPPAKPAITAMLERAACDAGFVATLAGVRVEARGGRLRLSRELGRRPPAPKALHEGRRDVFDGRFEVQAFASGWRIAPLVGRAATLPAPERAALRSVPAEVRPSLPAILGETGEVRLPAPLGEGPAEAASLVGSRLASSLGLIVDERALQAAEWNAKPMAPGPQPSYLQPQGAKSLRQAAVVRSPAMVLDP